MKYTVTLYWNGELVCHAATTAVVASDITRAHVVENFAATTRRTAEASCLNLLERIQALRPLHTITMENNDNTGAARAIISRL